MGPEKDDMILKNGNSKAQPPDLLIQNPWWRWGRKEEVSYEEHYI